MKDESDSIILLSSGGCKSASTQNSKVSVNSDNKPGLFSAFSPSRHVLTKVLIFFIFAFLFVKLVEP